LDSRRRDTYKTRWIFVATDIDNRFVQKRQAIDGYYRYPVTTRYSSSFKCTMGTAIARPLVSTNAINIILLRFEVLKSKKKSPKRMCRPFQRVYSFLTIFASFSLRLRELQGKSKNVSNNVPTRYDSPIRNCFIILLPCGKQFYHPNSQKLT